MELKNRFANRIAGSATTVNTTSYKPTSYKEMDDWLNSFSIQAWTALIGAYTAGGHKSVIEYLRTKYTDNLGAWKDKDLRHYWNSRNWSDFKSRYERSSQAA